MGHARWYVCRFVRRACSLLNTIVNAKTSPTMSTTRASKRAVSTEAQKGSDEEDTDAALVPDDCIDLHAGIQAHFHIATKIARHERFRSKEDLSTEESKRRLQHTIGFYKAVSFVCRTLQDPTELCISAVWPDQLVVLKCTSASERPASLADSNTAASSGLSSPVRLIVGLPAKSFDFIWDEIIRRAQAKAETMQGFDENPHWKWHEDMIGLAANEHNCPECECGYRWFNATESIEQAEQVIHSLQNAEEETMLESQGSQPSRSPISDAIASIHLKALLGRDLMPSYRLDIKLKYLLSRGPFFASLSCASGDRSATPQEIRDTLASKPFRNSESNQESTQPIEQASTRTFDDQIGQKRKASSSQSASKTSTSKSNKRSKAK